MRLDRAQSVCCDDTHSAELQYLKQIISWDALLTRYILSAPVGAPSWLHAGLAGVLAMMQGLAAVERGYGARPGLAEGETKASGVCERAQSQTLSRQSSCTLRLHRASMIVACTSTDGKCSHIQLLCHTVGACLTMHACRT